MNEDEIQRKLFETKIDSIQLDPFGYCNNSCWFCPRGYVPNQRIYRRHMPLDLMEHILTQFVNSKGSICASHFRHIWTGHYNEITLYRHFGGFLDLLKKYDLCSTLLSNGLNFNSVNIKQICDAVDAGTVPGICLNIPAGEPDSYQRLTGQSPDKFKCIVDGVGDLFSSLPSSIIKNKAVSIVVNGVDDSSDDSSSYWRSLLGPNAPHIPLNDLEIQRNLLSKLFPDVNVYTNGGLVDRGGHLTKLGVLNHTSLFTKMGSEVTGCANCGGTGGRSFSWAHINSIGELFLCCVDYSFEYTFGSLVTTPLSDLWYGKEHVKMIMKALDGICRTCCNAIKNDV